MKLYLSATFILDLHVLLAFKVLMCLLPLYILIVVDEVSDCGCEVSTECSNRFKGISSWTTVEMNVAQYNSTVHHSVEDFTRTIHQEGYLS